MKKLLGIFLCFVIMLVCSSCENIVKEISNIFNISDELVGEQEVADNNDLENEDSKDKENTDGSNGKNSATKDNSKKSDAKNSSENDSAKKAGVSSSKKNLSSNDSNKKSSSQKSNATSSKKDDAKTSSTKDDYVNSAETHAIKPNQFVSNQNQAGNASTEINNSVEEEIEENLPVVEGGETEEKTELVLGEDYGAYLYEGNFVNLAIDDNMVYSIFKSPNTIVAFDTDKLEVVYSMSLGGRPAEIQVDKNNLFISFPDLRCIKVFNKETFAQVKSISLSNVVSSFCIDGDIIYYSEDDQHCRVYCTNLVTNETKTIGGLFYFPKLLLNKEKGLLYIGETHSSGSDLYYYKTSDFSLHSKFSKNNYGLSNGKRTMFLVNDNVFWGGFRLASDNAKNIVGEYGGNSTYHADENFVITAKGVYETETYGYLGDTQGSDFMAVTSNKCLVAVFSHSPGKIVVAVPY